MQKPSQLGLRDTEGLGGQALHLAHIAGIWGINQWPSCGGNAAKGASAGQAWEGLTGSQENSPC